MVVALALGPMTGIGQSPSSTGPSVLSVCGAYLLPNGNCVGIPTQFPLGSRYAPQTLRTDGPVEEGDWPMPVIGPSASATTIARAMAANVTARNQRLATARF